MTSHCEGTPSDPAYTPVPQAAERRNQNHHHLHVSTTPYLRYSNPRPHTPASMHSALQSKEQTRIKSSPGHERSPLLPRQAYLAQLGEGRLGTVAKAGTGVGAPCTPSHPPPQPPTSSSPQLPARVPPRCHKEHSG